VPDIPVCVRYFDWCNRCSFQEDFSILCTEEVCEEYQEAYCGYEKYSQSLEDIKSGWEQPQRINDYPEETLDEANHEIDIEECSRIWWVMDENWCAVI